MDDPVSFRVPEKKVLLGVMVRVCVADFVLFDCCFGFGTAGVFRSPIGLVVKPVYEDQHFFRCSTALRSVTHDVCFACRERGVGFIGALDLEGSLSLMICVGVVLMMGS